jgi:hypothetical protein
MYLTLKRYEQVGFNVDDCLRVERGVKSDTPRPEGMMLVWDTKMRKEKRD